MHPDLLGGRATPEQRIAARAEALRGLLMRIAASRLQSRDKAEDVVQEALIVAVRRPALLEGWEPARFRAWMVSTVLHLCSQTLRRAAAEERRDRRLAEEEAARRQERQSLAEARSLLPALLGSTALSPQERACLTLRLDGCNDAAIARRFGLAEVSVRKYVSRAVRKIRQAIQQP